MHTLYKRNIVLKIIFGYLLAVSLMVGIALFSLNRLDDIKESVDDITNKLAVTRTLSQSITGKIRLVRFHAERYQRFYNQEDIDLFSHKMADLQNSLEEMSRQLSHQEWLDKVRHIQKETQNYEEIFDNMVQLIMSQQSLLSTIFLKQELLIENQLSAIRINVGIVLDPDIFFSFGNARNSFQLMRLYQSKYLSEENEKYYVMFKSNYAYASKAFKALTTALQSVEGSARLSLNALKASEELTTYYETFINIHMASLKLKKNSRRLDQHEFEITDTAAEIVSAIEDEYQSKNTLMQSLVFKTQIELVVALVMAISLSLGLIYVVTKMITTPIFNKMQQEARELKVARDKAEVANRVKSEFVANMSHEFRTPLNAVIGFSELLSGMDLSRKQKTFVNAIETAGKNLLMLINDILDLSKIEAGKIILQQNEVNLADVVSEIEQIFAIKISEKALTFSVEHSASLPDSIYLDVVRVRQILLNLVGNAIKFTENGQVSVQVKVLSKKADTVDIMFSVTDTGIGIPPEDQAKIFQSFEQQSGQSSIKYGGTGLGLSITKQLVEMMQGEISLTSTPGVGSQFDVILPDVKVAYSLPEMKPRSGLDTGKMSFEGAAVLVADDTLSNRTLMQEALGKKNIDVITADSGKEALKLAFEQHPKVIMLDVRLQQNSGMDVVTTLKQDIRTKQIPIIALTTSAKQDTHEHILERGYDGLLLRPIESTAMCRELAKFLKPVVNTKELASWSNTSWDFDLDVVRNPTELTHTLKNEIESLLQALQTAFVVNDFKLLGESLGQLGKEHDVECLSSSAQNIQELVESFDIRSMIDTVKVISTAIKELIKELENIHGR